MNYYDVIITPDAEADMLELRDYIAFSLSAPDTAMEYLKGLRTAMNSLEKNPSRFSPVSFEPWRSHGIRKLLFKNFIIYYRIDIQTNQVYILNVIFNRRDQLKALKNK